MHTRRNNVIQFKGRHHKQEQSGPSINDDEILAKLDKQDLICLITSYRVNGVLPDQYYYKNDDGFYKWNVAELLKCPLQDLVAIFQWAKFGGVE